MAEVRYIISEQEAQYYEQTKGHFSKKMAEWGISMMKKKSVSSNETRPIAVIPVEEVENILKKNLVTIDEECIYDAWYLYHMCIADYLGSSVIDTAHAAKFVQDTLCDPDGEPTFAFACFRAKCDVKGIPIHWERMI